MSARFQTPRAPDADVERSELIELAGQLREAIAADQLHQAQKAHEVLGERLERADEQEPVVVDLARERAKRKPKG